MRIRLAVMAVICLALAVGVSAQEAPKQQMMLIYDEVIKPDRAGEYMAASKEFFEVMMKMIPEAEWSAVMTDDMHIYYAIPIANYGAIDEMNKMAGAMMQEIGAEKFMKMMVDGGKNVDQMNSFVVMRRDDLSYHPKTMIPFEKTGVIEYNFYYLKPGMEFAAEGLAKEYAALSKSKGVESGWTLFQLAMGNDMPALVVAVPAKDHQHLADLTMAAQKKMGAEGQALDRKAMSMIRKFDRKVGSVMPELSSHAFKKPKK